MVIPEESGELDQGEVEDELDDEAKRGITYQIKKNKGLTKFKRKELRNPRVKHRMKFRKAVIRRKGQVIITLIFLVQTSQIVYRFESSGRKCRNMVENYLESRLLLRKVSNLNKLYFLPKMLFIALLMTKKNDARSGISKKQLLPSAPPTKS